MKKKRTIITALAAAMLALWGCGSPKGAAPGAAQRFERPPIKEVTESELDADGMVIDAVALAESGRADEALAAYRRATEKHPDCAAAWYGMSQLLAQRGWADSAEACARRATTLKGDNVWYALALAQAQEMKGDNRGLTQTFERIVAQNPEVLEYYYALSNAYIGADNLPKAVEVLNRVERRIGVTEAISMQKARLWTAADKPEKALKETEALAKAFPQEKRYNAILATTYMQQKRYAKAKEYYDRILAADPDDPYIHIQMAEYFKTVGKGAEADSEMVRAFDNPALDSKTKLQLLGSFYTNEEFFGTHKATTFRLLDKAMAGCADSAEYAPFYGQVLLQQGRYEEAAHQMETALRRDSSSYDLWELLLVSLHSTPGAEAKTEACARRAANLFPLHTLPHFLLALADLGREDYNGALAHIADIERWGFTKGYLEEDTYSLKAECLYRAGRLNEAWATFDRLIARFPDNMSALNNYAYYLAEQGVDLEKAERMSRRTVEAESENPNNLDTYGWILHLLGRDKEALPYLNKAVRLDPTSETLRNHLEKVAAQ